MAKHKTANASFWARWVMLTGALVLLIVGGAIWILDDQPKPVAIPNPVIGQTTPSETTLPEPSPVPSVTPSTEPVHVRPFVPTTLSVEQVGNRQVQPLNRIRVGERHFSLPDPQGFDPQIYAWDKEGAKPGSMHGVVNFTAHTYPPGQVALGNQLYDHLQIGDTIIVRGQEASLRYQVVERLEVALADYPTGQVLDRDGPPRLSITICSGERRGPDDWTMRTVWFAVPMK